MSTAVINKIEAILHSSYDTKNYIDFINELFPDVHYVAPDKFNKEFTNFSLHIEGSIHIGNYQTPDKKKIIILAVQLKKTNYVENSRSMQRSYAKKLIENSNSDAAIIAFYTENDPKWRLSFVRLDYEMKFENGKLKTAENMTPAKRYSYLVGEEEPCHTAISQFERFITDSIANPEHPTLDDLENAFSVEKVTKEFFELYCEKFQQLREQLEANEDFRIEAEHHNFTSSQFAKKLMGQIVFLYFLQKKGWLGVKAWPPTLTEKEYKNAVFARGAKSRELIPQIYLPVGNGNYKIDGRRLNAISDEDEAVLAQCVTGMPWGTGPHNFMRKLFDLAVKKNKNFYDEILEPLFYDALNVNRRNQGYYCPALHCRIPFLSGGLFEPIDNYDWEHNNFALPNSIFSNAAEKGREADGILDIFDRYNFTMSEDEPLEREVAIDPEMLGKVFENLLEIKDRKSKGAFYTPREIVHYMCQESLINYLTNKMGLPEEDIRDFILYGDFMKDEDSDKEKRNANGGMYISEKIFKLNSDGKVEVNRLEELDNALKTVRVADPAVGSGAFPLGMLNEIVRARSAITEYMIIAKKTLAVSQKQEYALARNVRIGRSQYLLKRDTIRDCIFAVDIEPSAVDIAQLRLWLSLVIDDEINPNANSPLEGNREPTPLPNLEANILCGNSLVDEFEGVKLIKESDLISSSDFQLSIGQGQYDSILKQLIDTQNELFKCENTDKKKQLKDQIADLRDMVIYEQLKDCSPDLIQRYEETKSLASKPYILWQLDFARVFCEKGGFDIIIGNPPYIGERKHKDVFYAVQNSSIGQFYLGRMDYFYFFFHLALNILRNFGICSLITTNYFTTALGGRVLRQDLKDRSDILEMINFNECKVFETALGQHNMITSIQKGHLNKLARTIVVNINRAITTQEVGKILRGNWETSVHLLKQNEIYDGDEEYIRLIGIEKNGDPINSILNKIVENSTDYLGNICTPLIGLESSLDDVYVLSKDKKSEITQDNPDELQYVKEFYKGSQIHRYQVEEKSDKYILYLHENIKNIQSLKGIWNYLLENEEAIKGRKGANLRGAYRRGNWWVLNTPRLDMDFSSEKIVTHYRTKSLRFALSTTPWYASRDVYYIVKNKPSISLKYILALLNSSLYYIWFYYRGKRKGDTLELYAKPLKETPIKEISATQQSQYVDIVDSIIDAKKDHKDTSMLEHNLDLMIYKLYGLSSSEISIIESNAEKYGKA